jgi:hypothetical protein
METSHPALFVLNTAQFVNATLNNNEVVAAVNDFVERNGEKLLMQNNEDSVAGQANVKR